MDAESNLIESPYYSNDVDLVHGFLPELIISSEGGMYVLTCTTQCTNHTG